MITDSGHYLLDCELGEIGDPDGVALKLNQIPGVVEHGLFIGIAKEVVIGRATGRLKSGLFERSAWPSLLPNPTEAQRHEYKTKTKR